MSGSFHCPKSPKDFNPKTTEMDMKEETSSTDNISDEEFIRESDEALIVDEIEIKYEDMDYNLRHNTTADDHSEDHSDLNLETMSSITRNVEGRSTEEKDLKDFYDDLLLCDADCETCVKYMRMLREHVRAAHAPPQPIQNPLLNDPVHVHVTPSGQSSSPIQMKSEVEENTVKMDSSDSEEVGAENSDSDPNYNTESESESEPNDPDYDYAPSPSLTKNPCRQGYVSVKSHTSNQSRSLKSKKENLPSREHFKCGECDKSFKQMGRLKEHMRIHTGENPFKCDLCVKRFVRSSDLVVHKRFHTGEKPFKCDVCVKAFVRSHDLTVHKRIHTGEKPLKCDVCIRSFSQRTDLRRHKMIHTGEKPFTCDVCEKSFSTLNILTGHKGIHTGEKPYACNVCEKGFTTRSTLAVHTRIHTGEKPFQCDVCAKSFSQKTNPISHKGIHTGERPYQCDQCEKSFILKGHRTAHKNKSH